MYSFDQVREMLIALFGDYLIESGIEDIRVIMTWDELDILHRALETIQSGVHKYGGFPVDVEPLRSLVEDLIDFSEPHVCASCDVPVKTRFISTRMP